MVHDDLPYRSMREFALAVSHEMSELLTKRDQRMDLIEAFIDLAAKYKHLNTHELHELAIEYAQTQDAGLIYQWAGDHGLSIPETMSLLQDYAHIGGLC